MEQSKIWTYFQNEQIASFKGNDGRLGFISRQISKDESVLNIGVGNGMLERFLLQKKCHVHSLDPDQQTIDNLKKTLNLGGDKVKTGYSHAIPFDDNTFDVVVMSEVLEHLDSQGISDTLQEIKRVLKPTGRFIGTVPAEEVLEDNVVICPCCAKTFHRWGHVQSFDEVRLGQLLTVAFQQTHIKRKYFISWYSLNIFGKVTSVLKRLKCQLGFKDSGENYYFKCMNIN